MKKKIFFTLLIFIAGCSRNQEDSANALFKDAIGIIGGELVQEGDPILDSTVLIYDRTHAGGCTGTLIAKDLVLTAAHCVHLANLENLRVTWGLEILQNPKEVYRVDKVKVHPAFNRVVQDIIALIQITHDKYKHSPKEVREKKLHEAWSQYPNWRDIAVLKLAKAVENGAMPVSLLKDFKLLRSGGEVVVAGYGITQSSDAEREWKYPLNLRRARILVDRAKFTETEVSTNEANGRGTCTGDSGGPAFIESNGKLFYWGITSRGLGEKTCGGKGAYTNVISYLEWIRFATSELRAN